MRMLRSLKRYLWICAGALCLMSAGVRAEPPRAPLQADPSTVENIRAALIGGVPMGRWKEGLLFEGIRPSP